MGHLRVVGDHHLGFLKVDHQLSKVTKHYENILLYLQTLRSVGQEGHIIKEEEYGDQDMMEEITFV
jgi:hypothetical protein